jgi:hypothetical protein
MQILTIDGLQRHQAEQKKSQVHFTTNRPNAIIKKPDTPVPQVKTGTGTVSDLHG